MKRAIVDAKAFAEAMNKVSKVWKRGLNTTSCVSNSMTGVIEPFSSSLSTMRVPCSRL